MKLRKHNTMLVDKMLYKTFHCVFTWQTHVSIFSQNGNTHGLFELSPLSQLFNTNDLSIFLAHIKYCM